MKQAHQVISTTRASWLAPRPVTKLLPVYFVWLQRPLFVGGSV